MTAATHHHQLTGGDPQELARLILEHPPVCPPWCTATEHPLVMGEFLADCVYHHGGHVRISEQHTVTLASAQQLGTDQAEPPIIGLIERYQTGPDRFDTTELFSDFSPAEALAVADALRHAASIAGVVAA